MEGWLPLLGVFVGSIVTLVGQRMTSRGQGRQEKREAVRAIAARALSASRETWTMLHANAIWAENGRESPAGMTALDYLGRYTEVKAELDLALDELTLMDDRLESEVENLRESVKLGSVPPGRDHDAQTQKFQDAHDALHKKLRPLVRP